MIASLDRPDQPTVTVLSSSTTHQSFAEITKSAWHTEVAHIFASTGGNGTVAICEIRQNKPWCELRCDASCPPFFPTLCEIPRMGCIS